MYTFINLLLVIFSTFIGYITIIRWV